MNKKFKNGDIVKVVKRVVREEGWRNTWVEEMDDFIGQKFIVDSVDTCGVTFAEEKPFKFPPSSLKLIKRNKKDEKISDMLRYPY